MGSEGFEALRSPANIAKHMHNIIIQMAMDWKVFYRPVSTHTQMASHFYCDTKTCTHSDGISWMFAAWNGGKMPSEVTGAFVPSECDVLYLVGGDWNMKFMLPFSWECHHRGRSTTNQIYMR